MSGNGLRRTRGRTKLSQFDASVLDKSMSAIAADWQIAR
jgi:hypothetical protein